MGRVAFLRVARRVVSIVSGKRGPRALGLSGPHPRQPPTHGVPCSRLRHYSTIPMTPGGVSFLIDEKDEKANGSGKGQPRRAASAGRAKRRTLSVGKLLRVGRPMFGTHRMGHNLTRVRPAYGSDDEVLTDNNSKAIAPAVPSEETPVEAMEGAPASEAAVDGDGGGSAAMATSATGKRPVEVADAVEKAAAEAEEAAAAEKAFAQAKVAAELAEEHGPSNGINTKVHEDGNVLSIIHPSDAAGREVSESDATGGRPERLSPEVSE